MNILKQAHKLAKKTKRLYGGDYRVTLAAAMRIVWAKFKKSSLVGSTVNFFKVVLTSLLVVLTVLSTPAFGEQWQSKITPKEQRIYTTPEKLRENILTRNCTQVYNGFADWHVSQYEGLIEDTEALYFLNLVMMYTNEYTKLTPDFTDVNEIVRVFDRQCSTNGQATIGRIIKDLETQSEINQQYNQRQQQNALADLYNQMNN